MAHLERDRVTWLVYAQLGVYGYFLYGFGPTVPLLRDEQDVSRALSGLHGTSLAIGALVSALVVGPLVRSIGRRWTIWLGLGLLCVGIACYVSSTALQVTLLGAFLAAFGGSFVVVAVPAVLTDRHHCSGPAAISESNAVASGVGTVAPIVVGAAVGIGLGWRAALLVVIPVVALLAATAGRIALPEVIETPGQRDGSRRLSARYWVSWWVLVAGIGVEFCLLLWAADIMRHRLDLGEGAAAAGLTALIAGMCVGRVAGGRLALRMRVDLLFYAAIAVCLVGFAAFWSTLVVPVALAGLLVCGLGLSLFYPLGIARAIEASDGRPDLATARAGLAAALASGGAPFVLGALADAVGIHTAFVVVPLLLAMAAVGVRLGGRSPSPASAR